MSDDLPTDFETEEGLVVPGEMTLRVLALHQAKDLLTHGGIAPTRPGWEELSSLADWMISGARTDIMTVEEWENAQLPEAISLDDVEHLVTRIAERGGLHLEVEWTPGKEFFKAIFHEPAPVGPTRLSLADRLVDDPDDNA